MQITRTNYNTRPSFTSYNNPIKSFDLYTPKGKLHFYEINSRHQPNNGFCRKLAEFFIEIFANTSSHPYWGTITNTKGVAFIDRVADEAKRIKKVMRSKDSTVLLAKDKAKNIVAAIFSKSLNESPLVKDSDTLYIDAIAVNPEYRGSSIGKIMMTKVLESSARRFSDAFLVSYRESVPFYKKLGFQALDYYKNPNSQFLISEMAKERLDYPEYAEFMELPLLKPCYMDWCSRIERRSMMKEW